MIDNPDRDYDSQQSQYCDITNYRYYKHVLYIVVERINCIQKKVREQVLLIISMGTSVTKVTKH